MCIALPGYIDREAWDAWMEIRCRLKAPNTAYAQKLLLYEVDRIKQAGHDPNAAINQSVLKGWKDVYPPKDKPIEAASSNEADRTAQMLAERQARGYTPPPDGLRLVRAKIASSVDRTK